MLWGCQGSRGRGSLWRGGMAEGCTTDVGQPALGLGCKVEAGLATIPMVAMASRSGRGLTSACACLLLLHLRQLRGHQVTFLPWRRPCHPERCENPGGDVAGGRCPGTEPVSRWTPRCPIGPSPPQDPSAHSLAWGSPSALRVLFAAPWPQEGCQGPALPAAGQGRLFLVPPAPPPPPRPAEGKGEQGGQWGTRGHGQVNSGRAQGMAGLASDGALGTRDIYGCVRSDPKLWGQTHGWHCTGWTGSTGFCWGG